LGAETNTDSLLTYNMNDSILVVANRYQVSIKNITSSYEIISASQIEALSNHSALELVDIVYPSTFVTDKKIMGYGVGTEGAGQVYLRGQGGHPNTGVLVLLNGHPDFMGIFGHPLPDVYGMDDIQQVEILAGPGSTVYGSQAMGGVINIISQPNYKNLIRVSAEGGKYDTYKLGLSLTKQLGSHGLFFTFRNKHSNGHINNTSFNSFHFQAGWSYQFNPIWSLSLQGRYVPYNFDDPERVANTDVVGLGTYAKISRSTSEIILENQSKNMQGSTQLYTNLGAHRFYDGFKSNDYTIGLSSYQNWLYSRDLSFATGIDLIQFGGKAHNDFSFLPNGKPTVNPDEHSLNSYGIYLLGFYKPWETISLKVGLRYQYYSLPLNFISPVAGLTVNLHPSIKLFTNYQTGFRSPTLMELYLFPSANEELKEETVKSIEIGAEYTWKTYNSFRIALYNNNIKNMIQSLPHRPAPPAYQFQNSGDARQWGLETKLKHHITNNFGVQFGYSYLHPDELTAFNPKHQIKYLLFATYYSLNFNLYGKYVDGLFTENKSEIPLPDYHVLNFSVSYKYKPAEFYIKLLNLLDRRYYVLPDYPAPGIQSRIGTIIKF
ncbi:TonB-dependent receptor, partial [Calditrichota bacterium]